MAGNTTRSEANESLFVVVRDPNTNVVRRIAFPADIQIGLDDQPAEMHLLGRLAIAAKVYAIDGVNQGLIGMTNNDTVVALTVNVTPLSGRITCTLPPDPRDGQIHFIKDYSGTASTIPIDIVPSPGTTIDNVTVKTLSDPYGSLAVIWLEDQWRILVAGIGSSGGAGAPTNASYVTINSETSLSAERRLTGSANILMTDQGPGASVFFNLSQILGGGAGTYTYATVTADAFGRITGISNGITPPSPSHSFLTAQSEAGLSNERVMSGGLGTTVTDGGTTFAFHVNPLVVPFLTGANVFTSPNTFNAGLSGSLTRLPSGVTYLVGIGGITITTGSNGQVFISGSGGGGGGGGSGGGDPGASYLVVGTTASLSNERQVQAGYGIAFQDGGANGNFIISAIGSLSQSGGGGSSGAVLQTSSSNQWVTAYEVNFKTQTSGNFGGNGNQTFNGGTWTVENFSAARWFGIDPQTGLSFDLNTTNSDYGFGTNRSAPLLGTRVSSLFPQFSLPDHRLRAWGMISSHNADQNFEKISMAFERYGAAGDWGVGEGVLSSGGNLGFQIQANHNGSNVLNQSVVTLQNTHNVIMLQFNHERSVDVYTGLSSNGQWPNTGSMLFRGNVQVTNAIHLLNNLTGSGELGVVLAVASNNANGNMTGSFHKFRLDYEVTSSLLAATTLDVVTASLTTFTNIPTQPTFATLCAITSSMTDVMFWGKASGAAAGANTVWLRVIVDGVNPPVFGNRHTFVETVTSGAGFGAALNGRITGLAPGSHIYELQAAKGSAANTPAIDPRGGFFQHGAHLMLMNLTQSMSTPAPQFIVSGSGGSGIAGINLSGSGTPVSGNPFANLNFTGAGVSVSNAGNGVATINIPGASGSSGGAGEVSASYVVLGLTSSLANERVLTAGPGIDIQDSGPGGQVTVGLSTLSSQSVHAYEGYCTGSVTWSSTTWADFRTIPGNFTDVIQNGITRSGSTFTVSRTGYYKFSSFFVGQAGVNGTYLAFRLSGSTGTILQQTVWSIADTQPGLLDGVIQLDSGSSFKLQYVTKNINSAEVIFNVSDPLDGENMRTGHISILHVADPIIVQHVTSSTTQSVTQVAATTTSGSAYGGYTTGSVWWNAATWTPFLSGTQGHFVDLVTSSITRQGSEFTVTDNGAYYFHANFNAYGNDAYISLRLSGSNGVVMQRSTYRSNPTDQNPVVLNGVFEAQSGTTWRLEYVASGTTYAWTGSNPLPGGSNMWTGEVSIFKAALIGSASVISSGGGADVSASYVTIGNTGSLPNERALAAGYGLTLVDGGAGSQVIISFAQSLSASGGSSLPKQDNLAIVAGIQQVDQAIFQGIGAFEFNPNGPETMAPSGSTTYTAYFQPIVEVYPTGTIAEVRLYNVTTNTVVTDSTLTGSSLSPQRLRSLNLSGSLTSGSNVYEMQMRLHVAGGSNRATCKGAKLFVTWS